MKRKTKKILIMTTQKDLFENYDKSQCGTGNNWGMIELSQIYETKVVPVKDIISNTKLYLYEDFDVLFMHNIDPRRILPIQFLKFFFSSCCKKKIICLSHASIFGKSHSAADFGIFRHVIAWVVRGYDKLIFFSPKSIEESVEAGIPRCKCDLIHWGADLNFISHNYTNDICENYWLSTGLENRDFQTMEEVAKEVKEDSELRIIKGGLTYKDAIQLTARSKGVVIAINQNGVNYCTGLTCVMDAIALGKPIIATRNPYYPFDIEKEKCGIYVDLESPKEISDAIRKLNQDTSIYNEFCRNSKRLSLRYNMSNYINELTHIIEGD